MDRVLQLMNELFDAIDDEFSTVPEFLEEIYNALGSTLEDLEDENYD